MAQMDDDEQQNQAAALQASMAKSGGGPAPAAVPAVAGGLGSQSSSNQQNQMGAQRNQAAALQASMAASGAAPSAAAPVQAMTPTQSPGVAAALKKSTAGSAMMKANPNPNEDGGGGTQPVGAGGSTAAAAPLPAQKGANAPSQAASSPGIVPGFGGNAATPDAGGESNDPGTNVQNAAVAAGATGSGGSGGSGNGGGVGGGTPSNYGNSAIAGSGNDVTPNDIVNGTAFDAAYGNGSFINNEQADGKANIAGMTAAQAAGTQAAGPAAGAQQNALMASLNAEAAGGGPVQQASQAQLQAGTDQTIATQMAMAASQQGGNPMLAERNAMGNAATAEQQGANQAAALTASNALSAQGELGTVADTAAGQQIGENESNAQLGQQSNQYNATNQQNMTTAQASLYQNLIASGMSADQAMYQTQMQGTEYATGTNEQSYGVQNQLAISNNTLSANLAGSLAGATGSVLGAGIGAVSDKRAKKNISDGEDETLKLLRALKPHGFEYKDEKFGKGHHLGVMAQDVETAAPDIVIDDTDGVKKLDIRKALSASLASLGTLNKRLDKLEKKRG